MPRRPRVFVEGGIYHVYNRFARGADIFREGDEADRFLELVRKVRDRDSLTIFAWCVMSNHYHFALRCGPVPLSRTMGHVQARFGYSYNRRHRSTGPVWQGRFKAKLIEDPSYLDQLVLYVHLNPLVAGVVEDPAGYPLSGHRELLRRAPDPLVDVDQTLALFGETVRTARRRYTTALEGAREVQWCTGLPGRLPWWRYEPDRPLDPPAPPAWIDEQGVSTRLERPRISAEQFLAEVERHLELAAGELTARGSGHRITKMRSLLSALAVERWRLRPADLAPLFGRRNDVVSRWVRWGAELRLRDPDLRSKYDHLDQWLSERMTKADP